MSTASKVATSLILVIVLSVGAWQIVRPSPEAEPTDERSSASAAATPGAGEAVQQPSAPPARESVAGPSSLVSPVSSAPVPMQSTVREETIGDRLLAVLNKGAQDGLVDVQQLVQLVQQLAADADVQDDGNVDFPHAGLTGRMEVNEISVNVTITAPAGDDERYSSSSIRVTMLPSTEINRVPWGVVEYSYQGKLSEWDRSTSVPAGVTVTFTERETVITRSFFQYGQASTERSEQWLSIVEPIAKTSRRDFSDFEGWVTLWKKSYQGK